MLRLNLEDLEGLSCPIVRGPECDFEESTPTEKENNDQRLNNDSTTLGLK